MLIVVFILFAYVSIAFCGSFDCINKEKDHILVLVSILSGGMLGGLLYSIQNDKKIVLPHRENNNIELGIIYDIFFGISGGLLIFLLVPEFPSTDKSWGIIKLISLAIAGGYSGRVLTKKVADNSTENLIKKIEQTDRQVKEMKKTNDAEQEAHKLFSLIINGKLIEYKTIKNAIEDVSQMTIINGFELLNERRKNLVFKLIEIENNKGPLEKIELTKEKFNPLIPLLQAILEKEEEIFKKCSSCKNRMSFLHLHYSALAYLYKDKPIPDWEITLENIDKAIQLYEAEYKNWPHYIYLFNKLLCYINLEKKEESESLFHTLWSNERGKYEIAISEPIIAPGLREWVKKSSYHEDITKYIIERYPDLKKKWDI